MSIFDDRVVGGRGSVRGDGVMGVPHDVADFSPKIYAGTGLRVVSLDWPSGDILWEHSLDGSGAINHIDTDPDGNVYCTEGGDSIYKIDPDGNRLWKEGPGDDVHGLTADPNQDVLVAHDRAGFGGPTVSKMDGDDGSIIWADDENSGGNGRAVSGDSDGGVHFGTSAGNVVVRLSSAGSIIWETDDTELGAIRRIAASADGKETLAIDTSENIALFDNKGHELWNNEIDNRVESLEWGPDGRWYIGSSGGVEVWDSDGNKVESFVPEGGTIQGLSFDAAGNLYAAGSLNRINKYDTNLDFVGFIEYEDGAALRALAVTPGKPNAFPGHW